MNILKRYQQVLDTRRKVMNTRLIFLRNNALFIEIKFNMILLYSIIFAETIVIDIQCSSMQFSDNVM